MYFKKKKYPEEEVVCFWAELWLLGRWMQGVVVHDFEEYSRHHQGDPSPSEIKNQRLGQAAGSRFYHLQYLNLIYHQKCTEVGEIHLLKFLLRTGLYVVDKL